MYDRTQAFPPPHFNSRPMFFFIARVVTAAGRRRRERLARRVRACVRASVRPCVRRLGAAVHGVQMRAAPAPGCTPYSRRLHSAEQDPETLAWVRTRVASRFAPPRRDAAGRLLGMPAGSTLGGRDKTSPAVRDHRPGRREREIDGDGGVAAGWARVDARGRARTPWTRGS